MKKYILLVATLALTLISFNCRAQFGIAVGGCSANLKIQEAVTDAKSLNSGQIGIFYRIGGGNFVTLQPGINYVFGAAYDEALKTDFKSGSLQIPVALNIGLGIGKIIRLYGIAEPMIGFRLVENGKFASTDSFKENMQYGAGLGVGVQLFNHLQISAKYNWTLGYVQGATANDILGNVMNISKANCNGISLVIGYCFGKKKSSNS